MKKIISVILTLTLAFCLIMPAYASDNCTCGFSPVIYVAALGSAQLTLNKGAENERVLFRPDTEYLIKKAISALAPSVPSLLTGDYDKFGNALVGFVNDTFGKLALDNSGNSSTEITAELDTPTSSNHGVNESFYFNYDFRLDPYEHADRLNECIKSIKALTGHDKVQLKASSMGGVVTMAYLERYGTDDIETVIFQCCPILGTAVAGELFTGKVEINKTALINYAEDAIPNLKNDHLQGFLIILIEAFDALHIWDFIVSNAETLIEKLQHKVYNDSLIPIFGSMPGIWSFVPDEYYNEAKTLMLNENQSKIVEKIDAYHFNVQTKATSILKSALSKIKIYIIAGYDIQRTPLVTAYMNTSDGTVDTKYASVGAVCADYGKTLGSSYTQSIEDLHNHVSTDGIIDASTCALPEQTWFIKDMLHCKTHASFNEFYKWLLTSPEQQTVFSKNEYPQFMQSNVATESFSEVKSADAFTVFKEQPGFTTFALLLKWIFVYLKNFSNIA